MYVAVADTSDATSAKLEKAAEFLMDYLKTSQELSKLSQDVEQVGKSAQKVGDALS